VTVTTVVTTPSTAITTVIVQQEDTAAFAQQEAPHPRLSPAPRTLIGFRHSRELRSFGSSKRSINWRRIGVKHFCRFPMLRPMDLLCSL
jgi:hypothetical protein